MPRRCSAVASLAFAQHRATEVEARSYIRSAFITGVAQAILRDDVAAAPQLRERLALPAHAGRDRLYEAIFELTADRPLRVRKSSAAEAAAVAPQAAGRPVFALEGGAVPLALVYDLDRNAVAYVGLLDTQAATGATAPPLPEPAVLRVADVPAPAARAVAPAAPAVIRLKPIHFAFGDAQLADEAKADLERGGLPKIIEIREVRYVVYGHADRLGSAVYNQRLSERRAQAVRDYLVASGVPPQNVEAVGLGASQSRTSCARMERRVLIECLAPDRRVAVEILLPPM